MSAHDIVLYGATGFTGKLVADYHDLDFCQRPPCALGSFSLDLVGLERSGPRFQNIMFVGANPVANAADLNFVTELGFRFDLVVPGDQGVDFNLNLFDNAQAVPFKAHHFFGIVG